MRKLSVRKVKKLLPHEGIVHHAEEFGRGTVGIAQYQGTWGQGVDGLCGENLGRRGGSS